MQKNKKIKVAFCIPDMIIGGVESVFATTIDALRKFPEFDIGVFPHADVSEPFYVQWFKERPWLSVTPFYPFASKFERYKGRFGFPLENIRKIAFSLYKKYHIKKMCQSGVFDKYDVIVDYVSGSSFKLLKNIKKPKITWLHSSINYAVENKIAERITDYSKIICISDSFLKEFAKLYPEYKNRLVRIYNPTDCKQIKRNCISAPKYDGDYFLCVGRMDCDKDIPTIISAFEHFYKRENKPNIKMVFIGDGNIADNMKKMAAESVARDNIVFLGKIPKPYGYMHGAMAHILSSYNEGLPTVLIEAMAAGTLNISSNCPSGPHEILLDGRAGILFEPGNIEELSHKMSDVFHKKLNIQEMKMCADKSLDRFDTEKIVKQIAEIIKETANKI